MTNNNRGLSQKIIFMSVLMVFGLALFSGRASMAGETAGEYIDDSTIHTQATALVVKDPDVHYFKIDVSVTQGDVVLRGFVNRRETEKRLVAKLREIRGVKSVKSLLKLEESK